MPKTNEALKQFCVRGIDFRDFVERMEEKATTTKKAQAFFVNLETLGE
jgi:hypothetical protein